MKKLRKEFKKQHRLFQRTHGKKIKRFSRKATSLLLSLLALLYVGYLLFQTVFIIKKT